MAITDTAEIVAEVNRRLMAPENIERTNSGLTYKRPMARLECADGFNVSVQASRGSYCQPRYDAGPWFEVECGYPSSPMPTLANWIEGSDPEATDTVWGYVPIEKVAEVLASHGGLLAARAAGDAA